MATLTYPLLTVVDDSGAIISGATVSIASVVDADNNPIASPGATLRRAGANVSVSYDAAAKGEAWITLAVSGGGGTFTNQNASPSFYLAEPLAPSDRAAVADSFLLRDWTAVAGVGSAPARCVLQALRWLRNKWLLPGGGPLTVYAEDDATVAWTRNVDEDPTAPPVTGAR